MANRANYHECVNCCSKTFAVLTYEKSGNNIDKTRGKLEYFAKKQNFVSINGVDSAMQKKIPKKTTCWVEVEADATTLELTLDVRMATASDVQTTPVPNPMPSCFGPCEPWSRPCPGGNPTCDQGSELECT